MLQPWERLGDETLAHYKVFKVVRSHRRSPRNGAEVGFFLLETWDWVNIVAITKNEELILVRQYRQGTDELTLEIPGGVLHTPAEDPADAARRELREETGYEAEDLRHLGCTYPNPAIQNNRITTYLATGCASVGGLQQDSGEDLEVVLVPLAEVDDRVRAGEIDHSLAVAGLHLYRLANEVG